MCKQQSQTTSWTPACVPLRCTPKVGTSDRKRIEVNVKGHNWVARDSRTKLTPNLRFFQSPIIHYYLTLVLTFDHDAWPTDAEIASGSSVVICTNFGSTLPPRRIHPSVNLWELTPVISKKLTRRWRCITDTWPLQIRWGFWVHRLGFAPIKTPSISDTPENQCFWLPWKGHRLWEVWL